jgi:very-short-patch-repair endonuclease
VGRQKIGLTKVSRVDVSINRLARERHGVVGLRELRAAAVSDEAIRTRLEDGRLHRLDRGVFAVGPGLVPRRGWWRAATLAGGERAMLSRLHAAALRDLVKPPSGPINVLVPDRWLPDRKGLRFHSVARLAPFECDEIDGIPVTSLARTLLDSATVVDDLALRRMYERAERLQILDVAKVDTLVAYRFGHRGAGRLRALRDYDPTVAADAVSELERLYLDLLRDAGIPTPQVNVLVDGHLVDCYWPEADLVVELDSYEHHGDREAFERDRAKVADLRRAGHEAVQFTYRQVTARPRWVVATTRELLSRGCAASPSPG